MSWFNDLFNAGTDTVQSQTAPPEWAIPFFQNYMQTAQNVAQTPYQGYGGQTVADLNPFQTQALNAQASRAVNGSPVMNAASGELQKTLGGGYLNSNPYLSGMIDSASQDITRNYQNAVTPQLDMMDARSGSFGNSGVQSVRSDAQNNLAQQLGNVATNIRGNDYAQERGRMNASMSLAPTYANQEYTDASQLYNAGQGFQQNQQANLTDQYQRFQEAQQYPYKQLDTLGKGVGMNFGSTTTQQTPGTSPAATGLGTAASLYSAQKSPTVICTELHRQGRMDDQTFALDKAYGAWLAENDPAVYAGYLHLAGPVVPTMQRSKFVSDLVSFFALPWATEMAHRMGRPKGSLLGKLVIAIGYPLCRLAAKRELQHG